MIILHISALPIWSMDGKGGMPSLRETLKGHLSGGHEIVLILPKYDPFSINADLLFVPENLGFKYYFAECRWLPKFLKFRGFTRYFDKNRKMAPYPFRWALNLIMMFCLTISLVIQARKVVNKLGLSPDLIYAHNQFAALSGFLLGRILRIPNVTRLYGTFLADLMSTPLVQLRYPTAAAGFLVPSDLLICANDGTRGDEVARKLGVSENRFRFWQNGVAAPSLPPDDTRKTLIEKFGPQLKENSVWIVSCSRLAAWKRIDRIINAFSRCIEDNVDCQLLIAGDGPMKDKLHKIAYELGVNEDVIWLGAVAHDDIWALINNSDIFIITNDVTNRCNPLYEAAWAGLPVVSIIDSSTSDLLINNKNALLSNKDNNEQLTSNLKKLCLDKELRKKLGKKQRDLSSTFWTWEERLSLEVTELEKLVKAKIIET